MKGEVRIMTSDYNTLLSLFDAVALSEKKAAEAAKPWKDAAHRVAKESKGLEGYGEVRFEKTRFRIACEGNGICSGETWWEDFPIELLLAEMQKTSESPKR
jgi:hypothetical protein